MELQDELRKYKIVMVGSVWKDQALKQMSEALADRGQDRDAFVLVLIDGDGMIFDDKLTSRGELGGREAAGLLWSSVTDFVHQNVPNLPSDYKVVTRIYANLEGLGDICHRYGITERPDMLDDFARGFTGSKQLFDFVDVRLP